MERTKLPKKIHIPDVINCSSTENFTQVPNTLLRNPNITSKAKALLCLLLSNKEGWCSHINAIKKMMKEGTDAIQSGLKELENHNYLFRIKFRHIKTKIIYGSLWAYTDIPGQVNITEQIKNLKNDGYEPIIKPQLGFPSVGFPSVENPDYNNNNDNNTNNNSSSTDKNITLSQFDKFWKRYPKKASKGASYNAWVKLCNKSPKDRPTWREINIAVRTQKESERWQDPKYIPHLSTWLNQNRWMDNPAEMKSFKQDDHNPSGSRRFGKKSTDYREPDTKIIKL